MQKFRKQIAIFTVLSVFLFTLQPIIDNAHAQTGTTQIAPQGLSSILIGGIACTTGGVLSSWLVDKIGKGIKRLVDSLPGTITGFLGINLSRLNILFPDSVPTDPEELQTSIETKERILDVTARCFAREILSDLTGRMIGAARTSGRTGGPAFVRDWRRFLTRAQYRGENLFRSILLSTSICNDFSPELRAVFRAVNQPSIGSYQYSRVGNLDPFGFRARCTMPQGWVLANYTNDFVGNGGWDALVRLAEPQNNFYGALLLSMGELAAQRAIEAKGDEAEALAGNGFTARRGRAGDTCIIRSYNGQCIIYKDILTPGSVLQQTVAATVQEELQWISSVDEWEELITYLMTTVMSRILNLAQPSNYDQEPFPSELYPGHWTNPWDNTAPPGGIPPGPLPPIGITGVVFFDDNQNGIQDTGETGLSGRSVSALDSTGVPRFTAFTDASGNYTLSNVTNTYGNLDLNVSLITTSEIVTSTPYPVSVNFSTNQTVNFGIYLPPGTALATATICAGTDEVSTPPEPCTRVDAGQTYPTLVGTTVGDNRTSRVATQNWPLIPLTLCTDANFLGTCEIFRNNDPDLTNNPVGNNTVSSVMFASGQPSDVQIATASFTSARPYSVTLQANNSQYVVAEDGGGSLIYANRNNPTAGGWEAFVLWDLNGGILQTGDTVAIQTSDGYYLRAQDGGGGALDSISTRIAPWEQFTITVNAGSGNTQNVSFQTSNGTNYITAELGGGTFVRADKTAIGPWEIFSMTSISTPAPQPLPSTLSCNQDIHNYYFPSPLNPPATDHYQPNFIDNNAVSIGYQYNGIAFRMLSIPYVGTSPVYMCYSTFSGEHMLSTDIGCEGNRQNQGIMGYILPSPTNNANTPIYRCWSSTAQDHYTTDDITECSAPGYVLDVSTSRPGGIQGYICD